MLKYCNLYNIKKFNWQFGKTSKNNVFITFNIQNIKNKNKY